MGNVSQERIQEKFFKYCREGWTTYCIQAAVKAGANINALNAEGKNGLEIALDNKRWSMAIMLIQAGVKITDNARAFLAELTNGHQIGKAKAVLKAISIMDKGSDREKNNVHNFTDIEVRRKNMKALNNVFSEGLSNLEYRSRPKKSKDIDKVVYNSLASNSKPTFEELMAIENEESVNYYDYDY